MTFTGIAARYAQALIDAILGPQSREDAGNSLASLNDFVEIVKRSRDLELVLLSPSVSTQRKRAVISRIADALPLDRLVRNFLYVLSDHRRLPLLPEIAQAARVLFDARQGVLRANVSAAEPLSDHDQKQLAEALGAVTGKQIRIEMTVDPSLIGGILARVGSTVYDGSVRGRLDAIGQRLASESR